MVDTTHIHRERGRGGRREGREERKGQRGQAGRGTHTAGRRGKKR